MYNAFDLNVVYQTRHCQRLSWLAAVLFCPLLSFVRHLSCHVAALVVIMIEEVDDKGSCRTGKRIHALPIPDVPPNHRPALVVVLVSLQGGRCVKTGRPRVRRQRPRRRRAAVLQPVTHTTEWNTSTKHNTIKMAQDRANIRMQLPPLFSKMV